MKLQRRQFLHLAAGAAALPAASRNAMAQAYPVRPVHLVVSFPPGGALDVVARVLGQWLSASFDQAFIVDNRPVLAAVRFDTFFGDGQAKGGLAICH
jgi:tripartite-type tricarboxylate transporter receptor subunit TctC